MRRKSIAISSHKPYSRFCYNDKDHNADLDKLARRKKCDREWDCYQKLIGYWFLLQQLMSQDEFPFSRVPCQEHKNRSQSLYHLHLESEHCSGNLCTEQLFLRMVFIVIARNRDDHTKNIAFLMNRKGEWKLSPAYDVTFAFDPANKWMKAHQLSINGKNDSIELKDLLVVAKEMNIKKPAAIIASVLKAVKNWKRYAKSAGVSELQTAAIGKSNLRF